MLAHSIRRTATIDEEPVRVALEKSAIALGIEQSPDLHVTDALTSPFLFGVVQPCVVLPKRFVADATETELSAVLTHELDNGATDVDPNIKALSVTFNMPMGGGMSWTGGGPQFPGIPTGARARWSKDKLTCTLPVKLQPNHKYHLGLNSRSHNNFQSEAGIQLQPVVFEFQTK